jgi:hypothetical protein
MRFAMFTESRVFYLQEGSREKSRVLHGLASALEVNLNFPQEYCFVVMLGLFMPSIYKAQINSKGAEYPAICLRV